MASLVPKNLKGRDLEILYRYAAGMKNKDIAADLGVTEQTISHTVNSDWAKNELALLHARTLDKISSGSYSPLVMARAVSAEAMAIQVSLMRAGSTRPETRTKIADSILDRAGYKPATRLETLDLDEVFRNMSSEEISEYADHGKLPARYNGTSVAQYFGGDEQSGPIEIEPCDYTRHNSKDIAARELELDLELDSELELELD